MFFYFCVMFYASCFFKNRKSRTILPSLIHPQTRSTPEINNMCVGGNLAACHGFIKSDDQCP